MPDASQADLRAEARSRARADLTDRLLSGAAGLVAVSALIVSVYQAYIARQQQKMSAWPYVAVMNSGAGGYSRLVQNVGLGPAVVRSMTVTVDGRYEHSWAAVLRRSLGIDSAALRVLVPPGDTTYSTSTVARGIVILPGASVEMVHVGEPAFAREARRALTNPRVQIRLCYCSVYDDCWVAGGALEPAPVDSCPYDPAREFGS